jgi:(p)ppGpp synthase/HD superfamily hydrolase
MAGGGWAPGTVYDRPSVPGYSSLLDRALIVAAIVHRDQVRKGTRIPYLMHPVHVAIMLAGHGFGDDVVAAALLHDALEDLQAGNAGLRGALRETFPQVFGDAPDDDRTFAARFAAFLAEEFGPVVAGLVRSVTDARGPDGAPLPTAEKRARKLAELSAAGTRIETLAIKAVDATHNARSIANDLHNDGIRAMQRFKTGPVDTLRWYADVLRLVEPRLAASHPAIVADLTEAVRALAAGLADELAPTLDGVRDVAASLDR